MERLSALGAVDIYYGDESRVSLEPCVPYAWQFSDETVAMPGEKGGGLNCFALLSRDNRCHFTTTPDKITGAWVRNELDRFAQSLRRLTVVVLDNAPVHVGKAMREQFTA
jgi:hypothetical protein